MDYWFESFKNHLINDLLLKSVPTDMSRYTIHSNGCEGVLGTGVDDTISCGNEKFFRLISATENRFYMNEKIFTNFAFAGITIERTGCGYLEHQSAYAAKLKELSLDATFNDFRTLHHKLAWLSLTKQDLCAVQNMSFQVTNEPFNKTHAEEMNKSIRMIQETHKRGLLFHQLNLP